MTKRIPTEQEEEEFRQFLKTLVLFLLPFLIGLSILFGTLIILRMVGW